MDANVSVHKAGEPHGVRTEIKNINSYRLSLVRDAIGNCISESVDVGGMPSLFCNLFLGLFSEGETCLVLLYSAANV